MAICNGVNLLIKLMLEYLEFYFVLHNVKLVKNFSFKIMMGVGSELVAPNLCEGQELSGEVLNKVFTQRTVWLLPEENMNDDSSDFEVSLNFCLNCVFVALYFLTHSTFIL